MRPRLFLFTCFATLVLASTANADTFCVTDSGVDGPCDATFASLQDALDVANIDPPADTIRLDPRKVFEIDDLQTGTNPYAVTIESATDEAVAISRATAADDEEVLTASPNVTLKRLEFLVEEGVADNVGIYSTGHLTLEDVRVDVPTSSSATSTAIQLAGNGTYDFSRVFIRGGLYGIQQADGDLNMERTLVTNARNGYLMAAGGSGASPSAHIWQSSFLGNGVTSGRGVEAFNAVGVSADLFVRDSLITNYVDAGLRRSGAVSHPANVTTNYLAVPPGAVDNLGPGTYIAANPMNDIPDLNSFELSEGIPRPVPGGNLVDRDPVTTLFTLDGENDFFDIDGNVGIVNGARDIGAFEIHPAPTIAPSVTTTVNSANITALINNGGASVHWRIEVGSSAGVYDRDIDGELLPSLSAQLVSLAVAGLQPSTTYHYRVTSDSVDGPGDTGDRTFTTASRPVAIAVASALRLKPSKIKRKKKGKLYYSLDKPATVVFTATSKKKGVKKPKTIKLGTQSGKAGKNTFTFKTGKLKKGKYTVTATPEGGQPQSVALRVKG